MTAYLQRLGFDQMRMSFAFRTAIASCIAMWLAWLVGLEHPQWSAMSVWACAQPLRGQLIEKSIYRVIGTMIGALAGGAMLAVSAVHPLLMVCGLAVWLGLCTWASNLRRGVLISYGLVMAGYTASMVALLDVSHPENVWALGWDRFQTVLLGVIVGSLLGYYFSKATARDSLRSQSLTLLSDVLRLQAQADITDKASNKLLSRIAELEDCLDIHSAGSLRSREFVRAMRRMLLSMVPLLLRHADHGEANRQLLERAAQAVRDKNTAGGLAALAQLQLGAAERRVFDQLAASIHNVAEARAAGGKGDAPSRTPPLPELYDWIGAREAGLRAGGSLLLFGLIWLGTGWAEGAFMLLGLSVTLTVFSSFENPTGVMRFVILGQILAVLATFACQILLWPYAQSQFMMLVMLVPFIFLSVPLQAHRRTVMASLDYSMVFLLMSLPVFPYQLDVTALVMKGLAVAAAPAIAIVIYMMVYPVNLARREEHLMDIMRNDVVDLAAKPDAFHKRLQWEARLFHRALRLIRMGSKLRGDAARAVEMSRAMLQLGSCAMEWQAKLEDPQTPERMRKVMAQALARVQHLQNGAVERHYPALMRMSGYLPEREQKSMRRAAESLRLLSR